MTIIQAPLCSLHQSLSLFFPLSLFHISFSVSLLSLTWCSELSWALGDCQENFDPYPPDTCQRGKQNILACSHIAYIPHCQDCLMVRNANYWHFCIQLFGLPFPFPSCVCVCLSPLRQNRTCMCVLAAAVLVGLIGFHFLLIVFVYFAEVSPCALGSRW